MATKAGTLVVYDPGETTLLGFRGAEVVDDTLIDDVHEALEQLVREHRCKNVIVDLSGVKIVSSGVLGYLFSLHRKGLVVRLYNPSQPVRDVLRITRLDSALRETRTPHM